MEELAGYLKRERVHRNLTIEALSKLSGISASMLQSFENCDFERFGASILLRNAVRAYCNALNLDSEPLLKKFSSQIEACNLQEAGIERYGRLRKTLFKRRKMVALPLFVFFLSSTAVFFGGEWISQRRSRLFAPPPGANRLLSQQSLPAELQKSPTRTPPKRPGKTISEQVQTARANSAAMNFEAQKPAENSGVAASDPDRTAGTFTGSVDKADLAQFPVGNPAADVLPGDGALQKAEAHTLNKFAVQADSTVWIQIKIDDQKPRSEMLHPGDHKEWVAAKTLEVVIGNAGGVRMQWNDQPLNAPHVAGRVLRFRLPDYAASTPG